MSSWSCHLTYQQRIRKKCALSDFWKKCFPFDFKILLQIISTVFLTTTVAKSYTKLKIFLPVLTFVYLTQTKIELDLPLLNREVWLTMKLRWTHHFSLKCMYQVNNIYWLLSSSNESLSWLVSPCII